MGSAQLAKMKRHTLSSTAGMWPYVRYQFIFIVSVKTGTIIIKR